MAGTIERARRAELASDSIDCSGGSVMDALEPWEVVHEKRKLGYAGADGLKKGLAGQALFDTDQTPMSSGELHEELSRAKRMFGMEKILDAAHVAFAVEEQPVMGA